MARGKVVVRTKPNQFPLVFKVVKLDVGYEEIAIKAVEHVTAVCGKTGCVRIYKNPSVIILLEEDNGNRTAKLEYCDTDEKICKEITEIVASVWAREDDIIKIKMAVYEAYEKKCGCS